MERVRNRRRHGDIRGLFAAQNLVEHIDTNVRAEDYIGGSTLVWQATMGVNRSIIPEMGAYR